MMKKLNIIIPTFNSEKTIIRAMDSIFKLNKDFVIQIIIVDDHSSDDTVNLINKEYPDNKDIQIKILRNIGKGVSAARNTGLKYLYRNSQAKFLNEYVVFLDADDRLVPDFFDEFIKLDDLNKYDYIAYYYQSGTESVSSNEGELNLKIKKVSVPCALNKVISGFNSSDFNFNSPWGRAIRLDFLRKNRLFFNDGLSYKEDFLFNLETIRKNPKICIVNKMGYYHYKNPNSVINNYIPSAIDDEYIVKRKLEDMNFNMKQLEMASYNSWLGLQYVYVFPKNLKTDNFKRKKERFLTVKSLFNDFSINKFNGNYLTKEFVFFLTYKFNLFEVLNLIFKLRGNV